MAWDSITGHNLQVNILRASSKAGRLAHAYLFTGPAGSGKETVALELAKSINCNTAISKNSPEACGTCDSCQQIDGFLHPNIEYVFPVESILLERTDPGKTENKRLAEAKERYDALIARKKKNPYFSPSMERSMGILSEQISDLQHKASFMPPGGGKKVFILSQAEKLNPSAANKLLKLLEEPPEHVLFILISSRPESVLPTIRSRCQILKFSKVSPTDAEAWLARTYPDIDISARQVLARMTRGNLERLADLAESYNDGIQPEALVLRTRAVNFLRFLMTPAKLQETLKELDELVKNLSRKELVILLSSLLLFFQDINRRRIDPGWQELNNPDMETAIMRFISSFPAADFYEVSNATEKAIHALQRNANPLLTLAGYSVELKNFLTGHA
ncbi:MAG TPA: DNA polymerase III subunit [Prosthecochloris aestuarii]|uniref:DNA polymerase III subunit n=1 Tax=Prosthecochloris aestuarii TaxID=1102 RepID=A0A831SR75_PROAE|nr:DNA polymerase III subunit [Prosthecochloris aestuarii]